MKRQLLAARRLLAKFGWVGAQLEPWCRDEHGRAVHHHDDGVWSYSVSGALQLHGDLEPAWAFLGRVVSPELARLEDLVAEYTLDELHVLEPTKYSALDGKWWQLQAAAGGTYLSFGGWLCQLDRTPEDLLRVFTTAILRSAKEAA